MCPASRLSDPGKAERKPRPIALPEVPLQKELTRMRREPRPPRRPVAILKGWRAFDSNAAVLAARLRRLTGASHSLVRHFNYESTAGIRRIADRMAQEVERAFPGHDEFDVIGVSMGGLLGRQIAAAQRLRIRTLYTVVTPHGGAQLATFGFPLDVSTLHMRAGSGLLRELNAALDDPARRPDRIVTYTRTRDLWVGSRNTFIRRDEPWLEARLLRTPAAGLSHLRATSDPVLAIDLARRLRGEDGLPADQER